MKTAMHIIKKKEIMRVYGRILYDHFQEKNQNFENVKEMEWGDVLQFLVRKGQDHWQYSIVI